MSIEYSVAHSNLEKLIQEYSPFGDLTNEAQTRFSFVDKFLEECLGWARVETKVETYEKEGRTDYELGLPRVFIVEAKATNIHFKLPPRKSKNRISLASLEKFDMSVGEFISQTQTYGYKRGVQPVALTNGKQIIAFISTHDDGTSPMDGDALVFDGYEDISKNFSSIYEFLSKSGIGEKRLVSFLSKSGPASLPQRLSASCSKYFDYKYSSQFQESLKNAASLIIEDLGRTPTLEKQFLLKCYCESGPLSQFAMVGKSILTARYSALFPSTAGGSRIEDVNPKKSLGSGFTQQALQEALSKRPIVLVGDVGVGKTSFLKHLMQISGEAVFSKAICINFDLGNKASLSKTPRDALLNQIETTLREEFKINLSGSVLVESLYKSQLHDFDTGVMGQLKDVNPTAFLEQRLKFIQEVMAQRENHLRLCLAHVSTTQKRQAVIVIDNADQRDFEVQQAAFLIAQEIADSWSVLVFLALRPQTFHASKRSGTISAYPTKIFVIPPPKLEEAIEKRLEFALDMAQGRLPLQGFEGITLHVDSLAKILRALLDSLAKNKDLYEFIVNVSSGNVRIAVELVSRYLGSPNVESERIVRIITDGGEYVVPLHEFSKAALLGDYSHFQEESSAATNIYGVIYADRREHFLSLMILGYLSWDGASTAKSDGFISVNTLISEMQNNGYVPDQISGHLQKLSRRRLIETTERRLLETGEEVSSQGLPEAFRITTLGAYHLKKWASELTYMEAVLFDTPVFDEAFRNGLIDSVNDDRLLARYRRGLAFRDYLDDTWKQFSARPYFDWAQTRLSSSLSFNRAERSLRDLQLL